MIPRDDGDFVEYADYKAELDRLHAKVEWKDSNIAFLRNQVDKHTAKIERLVRERHKNDRWNVQTTDCGFRICRGYHELFDECTWEHYIPTAERDQIIERCAEVCDEFAADCDPFDAELIRTCAAAIRALKEPKE